MPEAGTFESHLQETQAQIERLEQVFESLDEKVTAMTDSAFKRIVGPRRWRGDDHASLE